MEIEKIIREYIDKSLHMSLATVANDKPWVCELHFVFDNQLNIYWRSLPTRRHSLELMDNSHVSGNIVQQHRLEDSPHAVSFEGQATVIDDKDEIDKVYPLFKNRLACPESAIDEAKTADGHKFYKLVVTKWYAFGKFGDDKIQKYELDWKQQV